MDFRDSSDSPHIRLIPSPSSSSSLSSDLKSKEGEVEAEVPICSPSSHDVSSICQSILSFSSSSTSPPSSPPLSTLSKLVKSLRNQKQKENKEIEITDFCSLYLTDIAKKYLHSVVQINPNSEENGALSSSPSLPPLLLPVLAEVSSLLSPSLLPIPFILLCLLENLKSILEGFSRVPNSSSPHILQFLTSQISLYLSTPFDIHKVFQSFPLAQTSPPRLSPLSLRLIHIVCEFSDLIKSYRNFPFLSENDFTQLVIEGIVNFQVFSLSISNVPKPSPSFIPALVALFSRIFRLRKGEIIWKSLLPSLAQYVKTHQYQDNQAIYTVLSNVFLSIPSESIETMITHAVEFIAKEKEKSLRESFIDILIHIFPLPNEDECAASPQLNIIFTLLTHKLVIIRPLSPPALRILSSYLFHVSFGDSSSLSSTHFVSSLSTVDPSSPFNIFIQKVVDEWSTQSYVDRTPHTKQQVMTDVILFSLELLNKLSLQIMKSHGVEINISAPSAADDPDTPIQSGPFSSHPLIPSLMNGVQIRLSHPLPLLRGHATQVATEFSRLIDPSKPMIFGDEEETMSHEEREMEKILMEDKGEQKNVSAKENGKLSSHSNNPNGKVRTFADIAQDDLRHLPRKGDPTIPIVQVTTATPLSSSPLSLSSPSFHDENDLRRVPYPIYLRDSLDYLRKHESRDHIESSLFVMENMIRSCPSDLEDVAVELTTTLMQIGSLVFLHQKSLNLMRLKSLSSLVVFSPTFSVPTLIEYLLSQNSTLRAKLEVMDVLTNGAAELANWNGEKRKEKEKEKGNFSTNNRLTEEKKSSVYLSKLIQELHTNDVESLLAKASHSSSSSLAPIVSSRVADRTHHKYHYHTPNDSPPSLPSVSSNRFPPLAHLFFFGITQHIKWESIGNKYKTKESDREQQDISPFDIQNIVEIPKASSPSSSSSPLSPTSSLYSFHRLLSSEPILLGSLLDILSSFLLFTSSHPINRIFSLHLIDIISLIKFHENSSVRRSLLLSLSRIFLSCEVNTFQGEMETLMVDLCEWIIGIAKNDVDEQCKLMAQFVLKTIDDVKEKAGGPLGNSFKQFVIKAQQEAKFYERAGRGLENNIKFK